MKEHVNFTTVNRMVAWKPTVTHRMTCRNVGLDNVEIRVRGTHAGFQDLQRSMRQQFGGAAHLW